MKNKVNLIHKTNYFLFPAVTMLLGWGLRGYIGGGPFGAMIPGAMVAFTLCMLAGFSPEMSSWVVLFGVAGIGIGGEMTYGQTIGFLREVHTIAWGETGLTIKGAVWGLLGSSILATGIVYKKLPKKTLWFAYLFLFLGMLVGYKLIHQPKLIYFSGPDQPRFESWAALLFGAAAYLSVLKYGTEKSIFQIIASYAFWGTIGGGLGFGIGGLWMVAGFHLPQPLLFQSWWKMMEFTFGALFGAGLGYATWRNRDRLSALKWGGEKENVFKSRYNRISEGASLLVLALTFFWLFPWLLAPYQGPARAIPQFTFPGFADIMLLFNNFTFCGLLMILVTKRFPEAAWQIAVTITFSHAALDLIQDVYPNTLSPTAPTLPFFIIAGMTTAVAILIAFWERKKYSIIHLFLILTWSCIVVAFLRLNHELKTWLPEGATFLRLLLGTYFVHLVFLGSALYSSWYALKFKMSRSIHKAEIV